MKLLSMITFLGCMTLSSMVHASKISMWREPAPLVKQGKYHSLIVDQGSLQKAVKNSKNRYLFTEKGAGVKPLVLIGSATQIYEFILENKTTIIENQIEELPEIYMGITKYIPKERFRGIFPLHDLLIKTFEQVTKFIPIGNSVTDVAGIPSDLKALHEILHSMEPEQKVSSDVLYVKFSYLPEEGMTKIAEKTVSFARILQEIESAS